jgi:hypothetical protein
MLIGIRGATSFALVAVPSSFLQALPRVMEKPGMTESGRCVFPDYYGPAVT